MSSDKEALNLMNDSAYGLTASIWTNVENADSHETFLKFVDELDTGTVFLNRYVLTLCHWLPVHIFPIGVIM